MDITIDHETLEAWTGRTLSADDVESLDELIQWSSIPEAFAAIADSLFARRRD